MNLKNTLQRSVYILNTKCLGPHCIPPDSLRLLPHIARVKLHTPIESAVLLFVYAEWYLHHQAGQCPPKTAVAHLEQGLDTRSMHLQIGQLLNLHAPHRLKKKPIGSTQSSIKTPCRTRTTLKCMCSSRSAIFCRVFECECAYIGKLWPSTLIWRIEGTDWSCDNKTLLGCTEFPSSEHFFQT